MSVPVVLLPKKRKHAPTKYQRQTEMNTDSNFRDLKLFIKSHVYS